MSVHLDFYADHRISTYVPKTSFFELALYFRCTVDIFPQLLRSELYEISTHITSN